VSGWGVPPSSEGSFCRRRLDCSPPGGGGPASGVRAGQAKRGREGVVKQGPGRRGCRRRRTPGSASLCRPPKSLAGGNQWAGTDDGAGVRRGSRLEPI